MLKMKSVMSGEATYISAGPFK